MYFMMQEWALAKKSEFKGRPMLRIKSPDPLTLLPLSSPQRERGRNHSELLMQAVNVAGLVQFLNKTRVHEIGWIGRARGREFLCQLIENRFKPFRRWIGLDFCLPF